MPFWENWIFDRKMFLGIIGIVYVQLGEFEKYKTVQLLLNKDN